MANWRLKMPINEIEIPVNYLKHLMAEHFDSLPEEHFLSDLIRVYKGWLKSGKPSPIPDDVLQLTTYAAAIRSQRADFGDHRVQKQVSQRLINPDLAKGILEEFRACVHFSNLHRFVRWLPNIGTLSEADIRVHRHDKRCFYVECTSREPKSLRLTNDRVLMADILTSLRNKAKKPGLRPSPVLVSVFLPEEVALERESFRTSLGSKIQERFSNSGYAYISAVTIVVFSRPQLVVRGDSVEYYDTDSVSLSYPNPNAKLPLPSGSINKGGI